MILWIAASITAIFLSGCGKQDKSEMYGAAIAALGDDERFAIVETNAKNPVLLVTTLVYDDGQGNQAALFCDVYYRAGEEVQKIGSIESMGTAYPIAYDKSGIYAASGHTLWRFEIDDKNGSLKCGEGFYETFDKEGEASYTREANNEMEAIAEEDYLSAWEAYGKAEIVYFAYGASDRHGK